MAKPSPFLAGLLCRCPRCSQGRIFSGFLKVAPSCRACGLDLSFADSADGPAVFVILIVCLARVYAGQFTPKQRLGFEFAAWYWHFVDVVWIFLFACIYVWGYGGPVAGGGSH